MEELLVTHPQGQGQPKVSQVWQSREQGVCVTAVPENSKTFQEQDKCVPADRQHSTEHPLQAGAEDQEGCGALPEVANVSFGV